MSSTTAKKVRQELEEKLDANLQSRKKEIDELVMEFVNSKKDKKKPKKDESEEEEEEEEDEEEEEVHFFSCPFCFFIITIIMSLG